MKIQILQLIEGAKKAEGLTVVIDVFRAFSTACYVMENGAEQIIPIGDIDIMYSLKEQNPDFILIGERKGIIQRGFDYGNSPTQIRDISFEGKTVLQTTSAGTQGIVNAKNASEIITGSFVNAQAIVEYIRMKNPELVSLVCMGREGLEINDEDTLCAEYIKNTLENNESDFEEMTEIIKNGSGRRFFELKNQEFSPESDFHLCLELNKFNFILKADNYLNDLVCLKRIGIDNNAE